MSADKADSNLKSIVESIEKLNILEVSKLVKLLEEKFDVQASTGMVAQTVVQPQGDASQQANGAENTEKDVFNIVLKSAGEKKIEVIKALRSVNQDLGLKEAKDITEATPKVIKESVGKEEAEEIKKLFTEAGAEIELQ
ncbi:50S ribosomal protein L7/L12 [Patescibacteria group bacterium]|nr:50S ribosomal protein L7/L12 [Patescibacteria group bacterium]